MEAYTFAEKFNNPDNKYRSLPFMSLNGLLDPDSLAVQMKDMIQHGMGGCFMHSREGLETPYMGDEWMAALESIINSAAKNGGHAWLYDEDRFPSGGAGGQVQSKNRAAYSSKAVTMAVDEKKYDGDILLMIAYTSDENGGLKFRKLAPGKSAGSGEHEAVFRCEVSNPCMWFNNEAPADCLNPDAVREFINVTHEKYREKLGKYFGTAVPGIFTDEPNINDFRCSYTDGRAYLPWTFCFGEYFMRRRGYDITDKLPYLFIDGDESFKVRHDYWHTITELFTEAWSEQIGEWCASNGLCYTGHYMREDSLGASVRMSGAIMPHYMYQGMPGIDLLTGDAREYLTVRQVSSIANQLGRRSICEMYGCSGWDFSFEGQRIMGDWLYVMGVDTRCQHHSMYTLKGTAKRDFPPSFNYNNVWWEHNKVTEDYFGRLGAALAGGKAFRSVMILHPQSSAWGYTGAGICKDYVWSVDDTASNALQEKLEKLMKRMMTEHMDFDFGDEITLEKIGKVTESGLCVGQMTYPVIIMPWLETVLPSTKALLEEFAGKGGKVIVLGQKPQRVDGTEVPDIWLDDSVVCGNIQQCINELNSCLDERLHITDELGKEAEVYSLLKEFDGYNTLFIVNEKGPKNLKVTLPERLAGHTMKCDALTGKMTDAAANDNGFTVFLDEHDSVLLYTEKEKRTVSGKSSSAPVFPDMLKMHRLGFGTGVKRSHPNVLLLDKAKWQLNGGIIHDEAFIFNIHDDVRKELGMSVVFANGTPQRYMWVNEKHKNDGAALKMIFDFEVTDIPENPIRLAAEDIETFDVTLNGEKCDSSEDGYYIDKCIGTKLLPPLKEGRNVLILSCSYKNSTQIEDIYLTGDFGVSPERRIIAEPETVYAGDWCLQGYYHYAGALTYSYNYMYSGEGKRHLYIGEYKGVTACVYVNGKKSADIPWRSADGTDITEYLKTGNNTVSIEIMGSQRNVMGLFHNTGCQNEWVDWTFFTRDNARLSDDYDVVPCGLMNIPCILEE